MALERTRAATAAATSSMMSAEIRITLAMRDMLRGVEVEGPQVPYSSQPPEEQEQQRRQQKRDLCADVVWPYKSRREAFEESRARQLKREQANHDLMLEQSWSYEAMWTRPPSPHRPLTLSIQQDLNCIGNSTISYNTPSNTSSLQPPSFSAPPVPLRAAPRPRQVVPPPRRAESARPNTGTALLTSWEGEALHQETGTRSRGKPETEDDEVMPVRPTTSDLATRGGNQGRLSGYSPVLSTRAVGQASGSRKNVEPGQKGVGVGAAASSTSPAKPSSVGCQPAALSTSIMPEGGAGDDPSESEERSVGSWRLSSPTGLPLPSFRSMQPASTSYDGERSSSPVIPEEGSESPVNRGDHENRSWERAQSTLLDEPFSLAGALPCPSPSPPPTCLPPIKVPLTPPNLVKPRSEKQAGGTVARASLLLSPNFLAKPKPAVVAKAKPMDNPLVGD